VSLDAIVKGFNAALINVSESQFIIEMSGSTQKVDELLHSLNGVRIIELARSGVTGLSSSETSLTV